MIKMEIENREIIITVVTLNEKDLVNLRDGHTLKAVDSNLEIQYSFY